MALVGVRGRGTCRHTSGAGLVAHPAGVRGMRKYMLMPGVWGWHDGRARVMRGGRRRKNCAKEIVLCAISNTQGGSESATHLAGELLGNAASAGLDQAERAERRQAEGKAPGRGRGRHLPVHHAVVRLFLLEPKTKGR